MTYRCKLLVKAGYCSKIQHHSVQVFMFPFPLKGYTLSSFSNIIFSSNSPMNVCVYRVIIEQLSSCYSSHFLCRLSELQNLFSKESDHFRPNRLMQINYFVTSTSCHNMPVYYIYCTNTLNH